jgi:hypothetical protein
MGQMTDADQRIAEEEAFQAMIAEQNQMGQPMMQDPRATSPRPMLRPNR